MASMRFDVRAPVVAVAARVLEHANPQRERRQLLAELIVHFARDSPPLVLLREHQARQELGAGPFGLGPFPLGEIEMRPDDSHDRSARLAADRIPAREDVDVVTVLVAQAELPFVGRRRRA